MRPLLLLPAFTSDILQILRHKLGPPQQPQDNSNLPRRLEVALCRIRSGHTMLTHKHLFTKDDPPICPSCNSILSIPHILTSCSKFSNIRRILNFPDSLPDILKNAPVLISFLQRSNLLSQI